MTEENDPLDPIAERAEAAWSRGDRARADQLARMGLAVDEGHPRLLAVLAALAEDRGNSAEAAMLFRQALGRAGTDPRLLHNLGVALRGAGLWDAADAAWAATLATEPNRIETLFNLARLRDEAGRREEAVALHERLLALAPDHGPALYTLGNLRARQGRLVEAEALLRRAWAVEPANARVATNLGVVLRRLDRVGEALEIQDRAVALDPALADGQWNRANLLLSLDRYGEGFAAYEWRRRRAAWSLPDPSGPEWTGGSLMGKRLLVAAEQGAGDMIQAVRWMPRLAAMGARVILEAHPSLVTLFSTLDGVERVLPFGAVEEDGHDLWIRAFSLPHRLGIGFSDLASDSPPYVTVPPGIAVPPPLGETRDGLKVGLCWSGNPDFADNGTRACDLLDLLPLAEGPGVQAYSLQKGPPAKRLEEVGFPLVTDLAPWMTDYAATGAMMERLDLVVTTDTSVAHLAGALNRPCILLLAAHCDWRWGRGRGVTPWYPSLRLVRQTTLGEWRACVEKVSEMLALGRFYQG
ncbi:MAG: tetratricopeptide repeat protein [Rhodospirillum sp.]|nr:tetratricopeptide repeat protein [Rhodospirillum sp.]MCF8488770.1 tetratricopeptide repeat protein [Rhodospirillum sp.]MCF8499722.1 tetratricopeptide repeat protein [Rhodospirillum sp.]